MDRFADATGRAPLRGLRVVDLSGGIAGGFATRLLADAGADVIKLEPPDGDPLRRRSVTGHDLNGEDGVLFRFLAASKRSAVLDLSGSDAARLIEEADLLVESGPAGWIEQLGFLERYPHLVVLSISPFGHTGPWKDQAWTEFTLQAASGSTASRGWPQGSPVAAGGQLAEWTAGLYGAMAALAALHRARRSGVGTHIDLSMLESWTIVSNLFVDLLFSLMGRPALPLAARLVEIPGIEPTLDGWVCFYLASAQQFGDFCALIDRPDLADDEQLRMLPGRLARAQEWNDAVRSWTTRHTTADILERASLFRIPVAPLCDGRTVLEQPQLITRDFFGDAGDFGYPRPPFLFDGERLPPPEPSPGLGDHGPHPEWTPRSPAHAVRSTHDESLPLAGVKVLDLTAWLAGPYATHLLGALGADVIHVESIQRPDGARTVVPPGMRERDQWWEYGTIWLSVATNKRAITLDLSQPEGLECVKQLIGWADIVVENFSPRVMENFGLEWQTVQALNEHAVMVRMPGFGLDGPWRDWPAMAPIAEALSGMTHVTGFADTPLGPRGPSDFFGAIHAAFAALVGLASVEAGSRGMQIEVPLVECALRVAAEQVIEYTAHGAVLNRHGNRSPLAAPQGVYACRGKEQWLALTVETDEQWTSLRELLGEPPWAKDPLLDTVTGRRARHDDLDERISQWAAEQDLVGAVDALLTRGIPAAALADPRAIHQNPQLGARSFFESCTHPVAGTHPTVTMPFRMTGITRWTRSSAPTLGEHNHEVLSGILGLGEAELTRLEAGGIIGNRPSGYGLAGPQVNVGYSQPKQTATPAGADDT